MFQLLSDRLNILPLLFAPLCYFPPKPGSLDSVIYADTDVVFLANLASFWSHRDPSKFVQWGQTKCAGLIMMSPLLLKSFAWEEMGRTIGNAKRKRGRKYPLGLDDQQILTELEADHPGMFGLLPPSLDIHLNNGKQKLGMNGLITLDEVAFLHFNGGGDSPGPFFEYRPKDWKHLPKIDWINGEGWNLVQ